MTRTKAPTFTRLLSLLRPVRRLQQEIAELTTRNAEMTTRNAELTARIGELTTRIAELTTQNAELTTRNAELTTRNAELTTRNAELTTRNAELTTRIAELTTDNRAAWDAAAAARAELQAATSEAQFKATRAALAEWPLVPSAAATLAQRGEAGAVGRELMAEYRIPVSYTVVQCLSGHSLAAQTAGASYYDPELPDRWHFRHGFAAMVLAGRAGDPGSLLRDNLIFAKDNRLIALEADLCNEQFMGAARFTDPFRWGYEPDILALLARFLPLDGILYDIGANWGYFCWHLLLNREFSGSVVAFEPASQSYRDLHRIGRFLGFEDRMRALNLALGKGQYFAALSPDIKSGNQSLASLSDAGELVRIFQLDGLKLPPPSLIKLDVENLEADVLRGGRALIGRTSPPIIFENWLLDPLERTLEPFRILEELDYRFFHADFAPASELNLHLPSEVRGQLTLREFAPQDRPQFAERINVFAYRGALPSDFDNFAHHDTASVSPPDTGEHATVSPPQ